MTVQRTRPGPANRADGAEAEPAEQQEERRPVHAAREVLVVGQPRGFGQALGRVVAGQMRVAVEECRQIQDRVRRGDRNAAAAPPRTASDAISREGLVPSVIQTAMSGTTMTSAPGYFVAAARPAAAPAQAKLAARSRSCARERQQERQRDEEGDRHVGQHVMRLADVERHDRHQSGGERRVPRAPAHADAVDEQDRERARAAP